MPARRVLPTPEATDLLKLVRDLVTRELLPLAAAVLLYAGFAATQLLTGERTA